jgi:hypothetical protein
MLIATSMAHICDIIHSCLLLILLKKQSAAAQWARLGQYEILTLQG